MWTQPSFAKALSAKNLLSSGLADVPLVPGTAIPKLIHQSWKTTSLPPLYETLSRSWRETYPEWKWVLWTDEDNLELVKTRFPEYLELYQNFPREIFRVDFARNLYMIAFGGIYADLDFDSFRPLTSILQSYCSNNASSAFLGRMDNPAPGHEKQEVHVLCNAFMASVPGHPFWRLPIVRAQEVMSTSEEKQFDGKLQIVRNHVESVTGPIALLQAFEKWDLQERTLGDPCLVVLKHDLIYPYAWYPTISEGGDHMLAMVQQGRGFDLEAARKRFNNGVAYACTYWGATWKSDWSQE